MASLRAAGRMQRDRVDVGVSRLTGIKLGRFVQLVECLIGPLQPHECQSERIVKPRILRSSSDRSAQDVFAIAVATKATIEVGQVNRCGRILRAQAQRGLVFRFRIDRRDRASRRSFRAPSAIPADRH